MELKTYRQVLNEFAQAVVDDAKANLDKFLELKQEFPSVNFEAFFIHEDGRITRYNA